METRIRRGQDLEKVISSLDITPTMEENAREKYKAISDYLMGNGVNADFYPQGSFRLGTVIRPYKDGKDQVYDLDIVCKVVGDKQAVTPSYVKNVIGAPLKNSALYSEKLLEEDECCWTLEYAKIDDKTGFRLDLVPAIGQGSEEILTLIANGVPADKASEAIAITEKISNQKYVWKSSNPKGYATWFDEINYPFLRSVEEVQKRSIFEANKHLYASVEEVPIILIRSPLQRTIQILKRHRDVYYYRSKTENKKPTSAIITTLAAQFARGVSPQIGVIELLEHVTSELAIYSELLVDSTIRNYSTLDARTFIKRDEEKWYIGNPVDPLDNYADGWDEETAQLFFRWSKVVKEDFIDAEYYANQIPVSFADSLGYSGNAVPIPRASEPIRVQTTKPWRLN